MVTSSDSQGPAVRAFWETLERGKFPRLDVLKRRYPDEGRALVQAFLEAHAQVAEGRITPPIALDDEAEDEERDSS